MSYDLIRRVCAALQSGRVSEKAMTAFIHGGAIAEVAERVHNNTITNANLRRLLEAVKPPEWPLSSDQERAAAVMGGNFFSPAAFCECVCMLACFTTQELEVLGSIPWTDEVLRQELEYGAVLFPTHPAITTFLTRELHPFDPRADDISETGRIMARFGEAEARPILESVPGLPVGWHLMRTRIEPGSCGRTWHAQTGLTPDTHRRAKVTEVAIAALLMRRTLKKDVLSTQSAWCEDVDAEDHKYRIACNPCFDALTFSSRRLDSSEPFLGLLLSRK